VAYTISLHTSPTSEHGAHEAIYMGYRRMLVDQLDRAVDFPVRISGKRDMVVNHVVVSDDLGTTTWWGPLTPAVVVTRGTVVRVGISGLPVDIRR
jgi:hypothetical protein